MVVGCALRCFPPGLLFSHFDHVWTPCLEYSRKHGTFRFSNSIFDSISTRFQKLDGCKYKSRLNTRTETIQRVLLIVVSAATLPRTNAPTCRVDGNWTNSGGKASSSRFLLVGELARVPHYPGEMTPAGGYLHRTCPSRGSVRSGQRARAPVVTAACSDVTTGSMG